MPSLYFCTLATLEVSVGHLTVMKDQSNVDRCRQSFKYSLLSELLAHLQILFVFFKISVGEKICGNTCNII